ncbi:alpha/beta-hydrolase [Crucibulum laeve]|uniref:Alpha/beta-hydrolase n=1 Tax=Crucibulum laeve TaxID=68775 RepID=A0A5C3MA20_9AGAR|nr:alpha/beta-hydrolase [Crucibulum laeve]
MHLTGAFVSLLSVLAVIASPVPEAKGNAEVFEKRALSSSIYNDLVSYFKYASSAYATACARPNGNTLVSSFSAIATDTQGFVARDDTKKEIVVALRGSSSIADFVTDASVLLVPFTSPGVNAPTGTLVHTGFLTAWNSVASGVIATVSAQLAAHPGYSIATSGHSLGGALSSLAGIALKQNFPNTPLRLFTYGQPRTGNPTYAQFVNNAVGSGNIFRGVHTTDGVPTIIPTYWGYAHHGTEYWNFLDPSSAITTKQCASSGEDLTCSASIISGGINAAHLTYYNILASTASCT